MVSRVRIDRLTQADVSSHNVGMDSLSTNLGLTSGSLSRRELLGAGSLAALGAGIGGSRPDQSTAAEAAPGFGRAKQVLLLYIYGAWSQLDTFDPKPEAPDNIRGEFSAIPSCLPGINVGEHLPQSSRVLDQCTLIRSMSHPWNIHSASYTLTGNPDTERIEGRQRHPDQWPYLGSIVDLLGEQGMLGTSNGLPRNVMLPFRQSLYARPNKRSGTFGGFLGMGYDPLWTEFYGESPVDDPFQEITPEGRFGFGTDSAAGASTEQLDRRRLLLDQIENKTDAVESTKASRGYLRQRQSAFRLLSSPKLRDAIKIEDEPVALREAYGMTLFGQSCLAARRLLETDVKFVTVVWDEYGQTDESWDTHYYHHPRMKNFLLPAFDKAFATLMNDLRQRGMLDDTLVMCLSEHGRTPRLNGQPIPGRDHWSRAYCQLFAGAGVPQGQVVGATDEIAGDVLNNPINPKDILVTACRLIGIDPRHEILASPGRPVPLVRGGRIVPQLLTSTK